MAPMLMSALGELRREEEFHNWGFEPRNDIARWRFYPGEERSLKDLSPEVRQRTILGSKWTVPPVRSEYPRRLREQEKAPWPWQVKEALEDLLTRSRPAHWVGEQPGQGSDRERRWLAAALTMPWKTDEEACLFVEATEVCTHFKTMAVMGRWRQIALNPATPNAASMVVADLRDATSLWDDPRSQAVAQVLTLDVFRGASHNRYLREQAAYGLRAMREVLRGGKEIRRPEPASAILAVAKMALDPKNGDAWTRLYVYAYSVCEALDAPPIPVNRSLDPKSPEVEALLLKFDRWLATNERQLARARDTEQSDLEAVRAAMNK